MHVHKQVIVDRLQGASNPPTGADGQPARPTVTGAAAHQPDAAPLTDEEKAALSALEEQPPAATEPAPTPTSATEPAGASDDDSKKGPGPKKAK